MSGATDLTLRLASHAIDAGWSFRDATPLNIVFDGARPVLVVNAFSFQPGNPHSGVWLACGQIRAQVRAPAPSSSCPLLESSDAVFTLPAAAAVRQRHGYIFSLESWEIPDTDYTLEGVKP